ncbi:MAG: 4-hydroxybenzoyl-CoA reductase subunit beta [Planctomycetota bacterium]|jgi:xanthine dehydrogenase YagS FAD-binding subunit
MKAFEYVGASSVEQVVKSLSSGTVVLSGGTDLINRMKDYVTSPERVVNLSDVKELSGISGNAESGVTILAGTRLADVLGSDLIKSSYPALWQTTSEVGTPQIRNMASVGGNLMQHPRCWYYRSGFGLVPKTADGKHMLRDGDNRYGAIFMTDGDALYVHPSSLAIPLIALGTSATLVGPEGERTIPVADLYKVPTTNEDSPFSLKSGEILKSVSIPSATGKSGSYEARHKQSHDWPLVLASVNLKFEGEKVADARVMVYGVAPVPWRSKAAEEAIKGQSVTLDSAKAAGEAAAAGAKPLSMNAYKVSMLKTVIARALCVTVGNRYWEA